MLLEIRRAVTFGGKELMAGKVHGEPIGGGYNVFTSGKSIKLSYDLCTGTDDIHVYADFTLIKNVRSSLCGLAG